MIIGHNIIHFDQLPSTNAYAAELLSSSRPPEGTVITTDNQYQGKGQLANSWESEPYKNISLSLILYPSFIEVSEQVHLNQAIALAVYQTIDDYCPNKVSIKWPNDVYIDRKKVAGILIQNQLQGKVLSSTIVGIGINVNQVIFKSDAPNPTSIHLERNEVVDLAIFKEALLKNLESQYSLLRNREFEQLNHEYHTVLYQKDQLHSYRLLDGSVIAGTIIGVNDSGMLRVLIGNEIREFGFKEIQYIK